MIETAWSQGAGLIRLDDTAGAGDLYKVYSADKINSLIVAASYGIKYSVNLIDDLLGISEVQVLDLAVVNENRWVYRYDGVIWEMFFQLDAAHNHDTIYSQLGHTHDYAASNHDHDTIYARKDGVTFTGKVYVKPSDVTAGTGFNIPNGAIPMSGMELGDLFNSIDQLYFVSGTGTGKIWHSENAGSDSGLDADLLDGNHASAFALSSHNHDSTYSLTSHNHNAAYLGISAKAADADKLDGISSASFLRSDATDYINNTLYNRGYIVNETSYRDRGVFGHYDSAKTNHIWSMGVGYKNSAVGTNFGNLYGMAYKHTNNPTGGTMAGGHQIVFVNNGTAGAAIGLAGNMWTSGQFISTKATGTAPFVVSSTTTVTNLSADRLDGISSGSFLRSDTSEIMTSGTLTFNDNIYLRLGSSADLEMFSNNANIYFDINNGFNLYMRDGNSSNVTRFTFDIDLGDLTAHDFKLSSDRRLKKRIRILKKGVDGLIPKSFIYKDVKNGMVNYGFIAQDMLKTHPELVNGTGVKGEDGEIDYYSIKQNSIIALLVNEVQELKQKLKDNGIR